MPKIDAYEQQILIAFEKGKLGSVATKAELARFKAAARATAIKDRRVNIRLSSGDLNDIQVKALEEGVPYQTLIASVLHKFVTGRLAERPQAVAEPASDRPRADRRQPATMKGRR
jgi:predicted DNA binding CopG/RHH family protein